MKRLALLLMAICLALPLTASAVTITFDEYPVGTLIGSQYLGDGVYFSNWNTLSGTLPVIAADAANPTSPVLAGPPFLPGGPLFESGFWMGFTSPQNHVSFDSGYWNSIGWGQVSVYDFSNNPLATLTNTAYGIYTFDINYANIGFIVFNPNGDPAGAAIDNLRFGEPVPEPSTMLLLGSGLAGLVGYVRKRLKK